MVRRSNAVKKDFGVLMTACFAFVFIFVLSVMFILGGCTKDSGTDSTGKGTTAAKITSPSGISAKTATQTAKSAISTASGAGAAATSNTGSGSDTNRSGTSSEISGSSSAFVEEIPSSELTAEEKVAEILGEEAFKEVKVDLDSKIGDMDIDLGGKTIVYSTYVNWELPDASAASYGPEHVIVYKRLEAAQQKYNFKVEYKYLPSLNETTFINTFINESMAGVKFADVIHVSSAKAFPVLAEQGLIIPLDDYIDYELPVIKNNSVMYYGTLYKGKHYGTGWRHYVLGSLMMYNKDLTDREGQTDILDLVEGNQWNWGAFLDIAKNCTRDTNGDGIIDQYGASGPSQLQLLYNLINSNGVTGVGFTQGRAVFNFDDPQGIRALQFVSDLNFVHKVYIVGNTFYQQGKAAINVQAGAGGNSTFIKAGINSIMIPNPMGPDVSRYQNIGASHTQSVTSLCPYPREVARIWTEGSLIWDENLNPIDELYKLQTEKYPADWRWNPANTSRYITSEREFVSVIKMLYRVFETDLSKGYPNYPQLISTDIANPIFKGEKSVVQALDSVKSKLQDILDQYN